MILKNICKELKKLCAMMGNNIQQVVDDQLCTGCGTCAGLCPHSAIDMVIDNGKGVYRPNIDLKKCISCQICIKVCPGRFVDMHQLNLQTFGKESEDILVGNYINFYISFSTDKKIRYNSSSGGLVTELLIFALESGIIDGAIVTKMSSDDPFSPETFIARTRTEIVQASKSKYCPVHLNTILKEVLKTEGRYALVGLPCHIQGLRKAFSINEKIRERVILTCGLMCSYNRNFLAIDYVLYRLGIKKEDVAKLDYRGEGYLGNLGIYLKDGTKKSVPFIEYYTNWLKSYFYIPRCSLCADHTAELADISFGDNWMPMFRTESIGNSILISRTKMAESLLNALEKNSKIVLVKANYEEVIQSKKGAITRKKHYLFSRMNVYKWLYRKKIPKYNIQMPTQFSLFSYIDACSLYFQIFVSEKKYLWRFFYSIGLLLNNIRKILKNNCPTD